MKRVTLAFYALAAGLAAFAQIPAPATASAPPDTTNAAPPPESTSTTTPDNTRYQTKPELLAPCQARLDAFNNKPCELIFIGDSMTEGWLGPGKAIWAQTYAPRQALNFGVAGDKTQNVLWRLNNMSIQDLKPKVAVIQIGGGNVDNTPHEIADGVKAIVANTQSAFPGVKIILVSIVSTQKEQDTMAQANSLIRSMADNSTVYYLDLAALLPSSATTKPDVYKIWDSALDPLLTKALRK